MTKILQSLLVILLLACTTAFASPALPPSELPVEHGMSGDSVRIVQKMLVDAGFYTGDIDGIFGGQTLKAVKDFQLSSQLDASGIIDAETFGHLSRFEGLSSRYGRSFVMSASAYSAYDPGNSKYTYRGSLLGKGLVAVDPNVIPLGTRLYIPGYGHAIADDIGGAIKGNKIDLAFDSRSEALQFGRRTVTVYIVD